MSRSASSMECLDGRTFLISGSTGNLGFAIVRRLLAGQTKIVALVRPGRLSVLKRALDEVGLSRKLDRVRVVEGDITRALCGIDPRSISDVTDAVHCAADVRWH